MFISPTLPAAGGAAPPGPLARQPLATLVEMVRTAGESTRLRALALLAQGDLSVGEVSQTLGQSQPRVSRHMKLLTASGLVERSPEGAWVFYRLAQPGAPGRAVVDALLCALDPDDPTLAEDARRLAEIRDARDRHAQAYFAANAADWAAVRALHQPEADVESAILAAAGEGPFGLMVDVGCGAGRMMALFADRAQRLEGFDLNPQMLAAARAELDSLPPGQARVRIGDAYAPPLAPGCADLVVMHQVLHFLIDPNRAIAAAAQLLAPGGRLVMVDFAPHALEFLRERHAHRRLGFADAEIERGCRQAGLGVRRVATLGDDTAADDGAPRLSVVVWRAERAATAGGELGA